MPFSQASWLMVADCNLTPFEPSYHRLRFVRLAGSGSVVMKDGVICATAPVRLESMRASYARFEAPSSFDKLRSWHFSVWRIVFEQKLLGSFVPEYCEAVPLLESAPLPIWDEDIHNSKCETSRNRSAPNRGWAADDDVIEPKAKRPDKSHRERAGIVPPDGALMILDAFSDDGDDGWECQQTSPRQSADGSSDGGVCDDAHPGGSGAHHHDSGAIPSAPSGAGGSKRWGTGSSSCSARRPRTE